MQLRERLGQLLPAIAFRLSRRTCVRGLELRYFMPIGARGFLTHRKVRRAINIVADRDPARFARIKRDVRAIWVFTTAGNLGSYNQYLRVCVIEELRARSGRLSVWQVAAIVVHEATHARLWKAGFDYEPAIRERVERLCFKAEIAFAERLPAEVGESIAAAARQKMAWGPDPYTDAAQQQRALGALQQMHAPRWMIARFEKRMPPTA